MLLMVVDHVGVSDRISVCWVHVELEPGSQGAFTPDEFLVERMTTFLGAWVRIAIWYFAMVARGISKMMWGCEVVMQFKSRWIRSLASWRTPCADSVNAPPRQLLSQEFSAERSARLNN